MTEYNRFGWQGLPQGGAAGQIVVKQDDGTGQWSNPPVDTLGLLTSAYSDLVSTVMEGTERKWKIVGILSATTPSSSHAWTGTALAASGGLPVTQVSFDEDLEIVSGNTDYLDPTAQCVVFGDSGTPYTAFSLRLSGGVSIAALHPKHGDVTADFTASTSYTVLVCEESSASEDQQIGISEHVEYFIPSSSASDIATIVGGAGSYGTINAGYWHGPTRTPQLLGDLPESSTGIRRAKLGRKATSITSCHALNASGEWVDVSAHCMFSAFGNYIDVDIASIYSTLGYTSESELLASSAFRIVYSGIARRVRPAVRVNPVAKIECIMFWNQYQNSYAADLIWELTGNVPTNFAGVGRHSAVIERDGQWMLTPTLNTNYAPQHAACNLGASCPNAAKLIVELIKKNGTYHLQIYGNELVYDGDWGDSGYLIGGDYARTTSDDNGNVVQYGCYHVDTGVGYDA